MAGIKIVDLPALGRDLISTDLLELSLAGGTGSRKITGQEIMNASKLSVGNTPVVSGTIGRIFFQGTGNVLQQSGNLFWDATNGRLGIGTSSPSAKLVVSEATYNPTRILIDNVNSPSAFLPNSGFGLARNGTLTWSVAAYGSNFNLTFFNDSLGSDALFITRATNNIGIGTTTDAGYKLDVNGTARIANSLRLNNEITPSASAYTNGPLVSYVTSAGWAAGRRPGMSFWGQSNSGAYLYYSGGLTFQAINDAGLSMMFASTAYVLANQPWTISGSNISYTTGNVLINTTTDAGFKLDVNGTARVQGALTTTGAINAGGNLIGRTDWTQGMQLGGGTTGEFRFINSTGAGYFYTWYNQNVERMRFSANNNLLINTTTDAGYKLDVNGTGIFRGILSIGDNSQGKISANGQYLNLYHNGGSLSTLSFGFGSSIGASGYLRINQNAGDPAGTTSGTIHRYDFNSTITNSTGTAQWNFQSLRPNYNFTGTYSGVVRGFYYNPILTSMTGVTHFAFHSTSGRVRFEGLPTSPTGLNAGDIYNDGGTLKIV